MKNVIVLVIDRLHAGYIGPYGNSWVQTPALNQLATESLVVDHFVLDSLNLEHLACSLWRGAEAAEQLTGRRGEASISELVKARGATTALVTDDALVAGLPDARAFDEVVQIPPIENDSAAASADETHLAAYFAAASAWLASASAPFLLWLHASGLAQNWDAPRDYRLQLAEEDEPEPPEFTRPPQLELEKNYDPDLLLGISQAYAAQVMLLDECLGGLMEAIDAQPWRNDTLLVLLSARGFALGEHRLVGPWGDSLYGELIHAPCFLRFGDGQAAMARTQSLAQPADLHATLAEWLELAVPSAGSSLMPIVRLDQPQLNSAATPRGGAGIRFKEWRIRDRACSVSPTGAASIRTPGWRLIREPATTEEEEPTRQLYVKPDDRWEVNDVASRCPHIVESLDKSLDDYLKWSQSGRSEDLPPLEDELLTSPS